MARSIAERRLLAAKIEFEVHEFGEAVKSGAAMAAALGVDASSVLRTLVVAVTRGGRERRALVLCCSDRELDLKSFARATEATRARMATGDEAEKWTGQKTGGISALAVRAGAFEVWIQQRAFECPVVHVSGGRRGLELSLAPLDLERVLDAQRVDL